MPEMWTEPMSPADRATIRKEREEWDKLEARIAELEAAAADVAEILHMLSTWNLSDDVQAEIEKARRRIGTVD